MGEHMLHSLRALEASKVSVAAQITSITALIREGKRWTGAILGYHVQGRDQRIGDVLDFIVDDQTGDIRYLVVNAYGECSSRRILLAPHWTHRISWSERKIFMDFSEQLIQESPNWARATPLTRDYEARLHDHYGRPPYWARGEQADTLGHRSGGDSPEGASVGSPA